MKKATAFWAISVLSITFGLATSNKAFAQATTCNSQSQPCLWLRNNTGIGIQGDSLGVQGTGVLGQSSGTGSFGVSGGSTVYVGVAGVGPVHGVWGHGNIGTNANGVYATADPAGTGNGILANVGSSNTAWAGNFSADVLARGYYNTSDARLKTDIKDAPVGLSQLLKLRPVTYKWKTGGNGSPTQIGLIAQEVQKIFPDVVRADAKTGMLSINYTELLPVAIKSIQEQQKVIQLQEARIAKLERHSPSFMSSGMLDGVAMGSLPLGLIVVYRRRKSSRPTRG